MTMRSCSRLLFFLGLCVAASLAEFEDLSNDDIENLIQTLDYMDYKRDSDYTMPDYYDYHVTDDDILANADLEPLSNNLRQVEMMSHGSPFSSSGLAPVPHHGSSGNSNAVNPAAAAAAAGGTTKANPKNGGAGAVLPAYCDPPNPCPIGYTAKDGCLEEFENTSEFSRDYQSGQNCLCDSEHMFNCPAEEQNQPRSAHEPFLAGMPPSLTSELEPENPFLAGHKLPVAAKKGMGY